MDEIKVSLTFLELHELLYAIEYYKYMGPVGVTLDNLISAQTKLAFAHSAMDSPTINSGEK